MRCELRREVEELQRAFHETLAGLEGELFATLREANQIRGRWLEEIEERKRLHESLQILKGNVRVRCRIRPLEASEEGPVVYLAGSYFGDRENVLVAREATLPIGAPGYRGKHLGAGRQGSRGEQSFRFDNVFGPEATNAEVYGDVAELVVSALEGYNVCIFAYGQTGSGKTHSIIGPAGDPGIVVRATSDLFRAAGERRPGIATHSFSPIAFWGGFISHALVAQRRNTMRDFMIPTFIMLAGLSTQGKTTNAAVLGRRLARRPHPPRQR